MAVVNALGPVLPGRELGMARAPVSPKVPEAALASLQQKIGYEFKSPALLATAMTHASAETRDAGLDDNERLEFLGDRVLGLLTADALLKAFPDVPEGDLALRLNALVRRETLAEIAGGMGIGPCLVLSHGEEQSGGREKPALLADACEAMMAALYRDGGMRAAKKVYDAWWLPLFDRVERAPKDAKTTLQEWAQSNGRGTPTYQVVARMGPDHAPQFALDVVLEDGTRGRGKGGSKREAEQAAATALLKELGLIGD